jgi:hypothetical protein
MYNIDSAWMRYGIPALIVHVEMCGVGMADEVALGTCEDGWRVRPKARKEESRTGLGI